MKQATSHRSRYAMGGAAAAVVGALVGLVWYVKFRTPSPEEVARRCLIAAWNRDLGTLEKYQYPREARETGIDAANFSTVWREEIEPVYSQYRPLGDVNCQTLGAGNEGLCSETVENASGQRQEWDMDAGLTDAGPCITLSRFLVAAWTMPYKVGKTEKNWNEADWIASLRANKSKAADLLHRLGIHKYASLSSDPRSDGLDLANL